jgi:D-sedoheptulose 7-phosphate isomerase
MIDTENTNEVILMQMNDYMKELNSAVSSLPIAELQKIAAILVKARDSGKMIYIFGNGDSATNALHLVMDLNKGTKVEGKKLFKAMTLNENVPLMTAWTNDTSYEMVFKGQLENFLQAGDVAIGISGSGNSPNVIKAIEFARSKGAVTVGFTAMGGGKLKSAAEHCIVVNTNSMEIAEDIHFIIGHMIKMHILGGKQ